MCEVLADVLGSNRVEVHCAHDGQTGVTLLRSRRFDLALIDAVIPGGSGLELAGVAVSENTPVLIISGHPDAALKCDRFGFPYLAKPFGLVTLSRAAEQVMEDKAAVVEQVGDAVARMREETARLKVAITASVGPDR